MKFVRLNLGRKFGRPHAHAEPGRAVPAPALRTANRSFRPETVAARPVAPMLAAPVDTAPLGPGPGVQAEVERVEALALRDDGGYLQSRSAGEPGTRQPGLDHEGV